MVLVHINIKKKSIDTIIDSKHSDVRPAIIKAIKEDPKALFDLHMLYSYPHHDIVTDNMRIDEWGTNRDLVIIEVYLVE